MRNPFGSIVSSVSGFVKRRREKKEKEKLARPKPILRDSGYSETNLLLRATTESLQTGSSHPSSSRSQAPAPHVVARVQEQFPSPFVSPLQSTLPSTQSEDRASTIHRDCRFPSPPPHYSPDAFPRIDLSQANAAFSPSSGSLYGSDYCSQSQISSLDLDLPSQARWSTSRQPSASSSIRSQEGVVRARQVPATAMRSVTEGVATGEGDTG